MPPISRRQFNLGLLTATAGMIAGVPRPGAAAASELQSFAALEAYIADKALAKKDMGLSAYCFNAKDILWSFGHGFANREEQVPYTPDHIQNIGSISKTITGAAVMQLVEAGKVDLDADINTYLPFPVRNPNHPDQAITTRLLLIHHSSVQDGPSYGDSYACGDPTVTLRDWVEGYVSPGGAYYDSEKNFLADAPGTQHEYANVGYGILGLLVEEVTGTEFSLYCKEHIFAPLNMNNTGWRIKDIDEATHAVPYQYATNAMLKVEHARALYSGTPEARTLAPLCLYSFPNYPDGLIRTSVHQLARFGQAFLNDGGAILKPETVQEIFRTQRENSDEPGSTQGLTWYGRSMPEGNQYWYHSGGDPGISTFLALRPETQTGAVVFTNTESGNRIGKVVLTALKLAAKTME